jgi:serine kinase of HPr protein (carbohydrate metabolism regulator)
LRRYGIFEIHSAGMVQPETEKGVVIVGPSGSGKSTLALNLAVAGWPYLSDDELLLSFDGGQVEARGFRSFFAVSGADGVLKTCFEPDAVFTSQRRQRAIPGLLLFNRLSGEHKTELKKLTQVETMARLIRACPWATYDTSIAGANLEMLSALARQTSAFDLQAGRDLLQPGFASDLLSQINGD